MKLTTGLMNNLIKLSKGESIASSKLKGDWIDAMLKEGVLMKESHGQHTSLRVVDEEAYLSYIADQFGLTDLRKALSIIEDKDASRAEQVQALGDSKIVQQRTMKGFLVNSYTDITARLCGKLLIIHPVEGSFTYIYDYESFTIPEDVVVIGVENSENFRQIAKQKYLFKGYPTPLFVSRYPQNGDLIRWLEKIPNYYIHFGDFDLAGIHIFLSEFFSHLGPSRSELFVPSDIAERLPNGSRTRYEVQYPQYGKIHITDPRLTPLVNLIHKYHRGYDQEGYIL